MNHAIPFDTLAFVKELEGAGVPPAQAESPGKGSGHGHETGGCPYG
ncbi:MAG: hypothetical protein HQL96_11985 [Magnetococcales bacterium]|nr:hypothetical protein [Magnetococcales bacterium]